MELSLILVILSGGGVIFLLAIRFLSIKNLSRDELYQGIVLSRPFFCDFNKFLTPIANPRCPFLKSPWCAPAPKVWRAMAVS